MNWLAILLSLASLGGSASPSEVKPRKQQCATAKQQAAKQQAKKRQAPKRCKAKTKKTKPRQQPTATRPADPGAPRQDEGDAPRRSQPDPEATPTPTATPKPNATPTATPAPTPPPIPTPTPTPAPPGTYPTRTNVDLDEWFVRASYRILAAGSIDFNVNNRGEDDHNLAVRAGTREHGKLDVAPGDTGTLTLDLGLGSYTLYCSLPDHEEAGMRVDISVR